MTKTLWLAILSISLGAAGQTNFVYTNDGGFPNNTVSAFRVNLDGSLTLLAGSPFATGGNGASTDVNAGKITTATSESGNFLYAANNNDGTVSAFRIDHLTGQLTPLSGSPFPASAPNPNSNFSLAASPDGKRLFATDEVTTVIHAFAIEEQTGALVEIPASPFAAGALMEGLKVSPNGRFLVAGLKSAHAVGVFAIDNDGSLEAAPGSPFPATGLATAVDVNCGNDRVFISNAGLSTIDVYRMAADGTLSLVPGSPFASGGTSTINALTLSVDNRHLFTSDLFNDAVSSLTVLDNGSLQIVAGSPFPDTDFVGAIAGTRSGDFVYASVVSESAVDGWSISHDGKLTPVPGRPFFTEQPGFFVQSLTTFPPPTCK